MALPAEELVAVNADGHLVALAVLAAVVVVGEAQRVAAVGQLDADGQHDAADWRQRCRGSGRGHQGAGLRRRRHRCGLRGIPAARVLCVVRELRFVRGPEPSVLRLSQQLPVQRPGHQVRLDAVSELQRLPVAWLASRAELRALRLPRDP